MFERYTEKARRAIFFARFEASQFGSPVIDTDHLLLGLMREEKPLFLRSLPEVQSREIRCAIEGWSERRPTIPTNVDMPLSKASKHVFYLARDEADRMNSKHIGSEHLLLGLLQKKCKASDLLREMGADIAQLRVKFEREQERSNSSISANEQLLARVRLRNRETPAVSRND